MTRTIAYYSKTKGMFFPPTNHPAIHLSHAIIRTITIEDVRNRATNEGNITRGHRNHNPGGWVCGVIGWNTQSVSVQFFDMVEQGLCRRKRKNGVAVTASKQGN